MQNRLSNLDCARGVAAFGVVLYHCGFSEWAPWYWGSMDFFFVLSGLLITKSLINLIKFDGTLLHFLLYRAARLLPVMVIVLAGYEAAVLLLNNSFIPIDINHNRQSLETLPYLLLFQNTDLMIYGEQTFRRIPELVHFWSLMLEEQFYLCWGILVFTAWRKNVVLNVPVFLTLIALIVSSVVVRYHGGHLWTIAGRLDGFLVGTLLGMFMYGNVSQGIRKIYSHSEPFLSPIFAITCGWLLFSSANMYSYEGKAINSPTVWIDVTAFSLWSAFIIVKLIKSTSEQPRTSTIYRAMHYFGIISYELYVLHMPVAISIKKVIQPGTITDNILIACLTLAITVPAAHMLHYRVTRPALKNRRRISEVLDGFTNHCKTALTKLINRTPSFRFNSREI